MYVPITVNGVKYKNIKRACRAFNQSYAVVHQRLKRGYSIEQAFSLPNLRKTPSRDHLGVSYSSFTEMCKAWNTSFCTVNKRLNLGWSIKEALTIPKGKENFPVELSPYLTEDHLGHKFANKKAMCDFWKISLSVFRYRIQKGMSIKKSLTTPVKSNKKNGIGGVKNEVRFSKKHP